MSFVYLIGGATGIGTSRIALGLAMEEDVKVKSVIGTDSLRAALRKVIGRGVCPPLFYSSFDGDLGQKRAGAHSMMTLTWSSPLMKNKPV